MTADDRLPWFPCYPSKLLGALAGMPPDVGYVYTVVLLRTYEVGGPCPDLAAVLARRTGLTASRVSKAIDWLVEQQKLILTDGGLANPYADKVLADLGARRLSKANAASSGAREKWHSSKRSERLTDARKKGSHTGIEWDALVVYCGNKCVRCGTLGKVVKDHIIPIYQGGSDAIGNLQPLCSHCNMSKGSDDFDHRPKGWKNAIISINNACQKPADTTETPTHLHLYKQEQKKVSKQESPRLREDDYPPDAFDRFWTLYPPGRKGAKKATASKFDGIRRRGEVTFDRLMAGLQRFVDSRPDPQYTKAPEVWLNKGCWDDEYIQRGGFNGKTQAASDISKLGFSGIASRLRAGFAETERPAPEDLQPINRR